jgi:hypothetical protein
MKTELTIRENLENNVLGKFQAYGKRIETVLHIFIIDSTYTHCVLDQNNSPSYS